jgi:hypothetical protein
VSLDCPCEFGPHFEVGVFSRRWHELHRDHHLAVFPDVDEGTRRNLAEFIESAYDVRVRARAIHHEWCKASENNAPCYGPTDGDVRRAIADEVTP